MLNQTERNPKKAFAHSPRGKVRRNDRRAVIRAKRGWLYDTAA